MNYCFSLCIEHLVYSVLQVYNAGWVALELFTQYHYGHFKVFPLFQRDLGLGDAEAIAMIPSLLLKMEEKLHLSGLLEEECWTLATCEANRPGAQFKKSALGGAIRDIAR